MNDFVMVILSHGRASSIPTLRTLERCGYTGEIIILIDDEDEQQSEYKEKYGDKVKVFSKELYEPLVDTADLVDHRKAVVYARNAVFDVVRDAGYTYFMVLDDDYASFRIRFTKDYLYKQQLITDLDRLLELLLEYYKATPYKTIAFAQDGDLIAGKNNVMMKAISSKRKAMNSFLCSVNRPFKFFGRINEDVNSYVTLGRRGDLFLQINYITLTQGTTQANDGGLTDIYLDLGTYVKSFYSVMFAPSCVIVNEMGVNHRRLHHRIDWGRCTPKIINEKYRKKANA